LNNFGVVLTSDYYLDFFYIKYKKFSVLFYE
jgi:hypothetical protein